MKQYLLFTYSQYYPCGGWHDFKDSYDTIEEAREAGMVSSYDDYYQIVDTGTTREVEFGSCKRQ